MVKFLNECERLMIDFAKEKDMSPEDMMDSFQTALLNIADWICMFYKYSNKECEKFMREYAENISVAIDRRFRKEE